MHSVYRIKASELDQHFLESLKAAYQDKEIEIIVYEVDETAYLLGHPANRARLLQAVENVNNRANLVEARLDSTP